MAKQTLVREQKQVRFRLAALRSRNFTLLWLGGIVSYIGTQMQLIGTAWLVVHYANSALLLGVLSLCSALPLTVLSLPGGMLADRVNRITLLKWARGIQIILPVLITYLLLTGHLQFWMLCVHTFLVGTATAFSLPANQALLPSLVAKEDVLSATSLQSGMFASATLIGPALGGLLLQPLGVAGLYIADALSTLAVFIPLFLLQELSAQEHRKMQIPRQPVIGGVYSIFQHRSILALLGMVICTSLLQGSYQTLMPIFARVTFHVGADGYGWLRSAAGAGALLSSFMLSAIGNARHKASFSVGIILIQACLLLLFANIPFYGLALGLIFLVGIAGTIAATFVQTQLYLLAPEHARNSIMALNVVALVGFNALGGVIGGSLAQFYGVSIAVSCLALVGVAGTLLLKQFLPEQRIDEIAGSRER